MDSSDEAANEPTAIDRPLGAWWAQGLRTLLLQRPDWQALRLTPGVLVTLWLVPALLGIGVQRLLVEGPATFYAPALLVVGWLGLVTWLVLAWALMQGRLASAPPPHQPLAPVALLCAQSLWVQLVAALVFVPLVRSGAYAGDDELQGPAQVISYAYLSWVLLAQVLLLWRVSVRPWPWRAGAAVTLVVLSVVQQVYLPVRHWYPDMPTAASAPPRLTQEMMEAQGAALARDLQALAPQRPGRIDVYAITFAPYADEDVFGRESELVAGVMAERFDATDRTLQLVSSRAEQPRHAWATPLNLRRAIERVAAVMDREEDLLFLHLTSHGARNGQLAAAMWPLDVEALTPQRLSALLDAAGIRHRVISISACYSGSWIAPLTNEQALVMTAADAEHTSYGCGRGSPLTYFGRAMFDEQLRRTRSFEEAHAAARGVIEQREKQAGKSDGYSNPQIAVGASVRARLAELERQLTRR